MFWSENHFGGVVICPLMDLWVQIMKAMIHAVVKLVTMKGGGELDILGFWISVPPKIPSCTCSVLSKIPSLVMWIGTGWCELLKNTPLHFDDYSKNSLLFHGYIYLNFAMETKPPHTVCTYLIGSLQVQQQQVLRDSVVGGDVIIGDNGRVSG